VTGADDVVVVTGTSSGLGRACATRLGRAGYHVVGIARREVAPVDLGLGVGSYSHQRFDLADVESIAGLVADLVARFGKPYGLVNNAAVGTDGLLPTMHNSQIEDLVRVNVTAPIVLTKYVVRHMLTERRGRIVNISSIVARTGFRGLSAYAATKAALEGFTRSLARDVGRRRITVNAVAPGFVSTDMNAALTSEDLDRIKGRSALGRFAAPDEIAGAVEYLLGPAAAGVTGTILTVDAGSTA
jgi:3-oxoacyl-[acyl-carrier protein] reductase